MLRIRTANLGGRFSPGGAFGGRGHGLDSSRPHSFQSPGVSKISPTPAAPWLAFSPPLRSPASCPRSTSAFPFGRLPPCAASWPGWQPSPARPACRPERRSASIQSTTLVAAGFDLGVIGLPARFRLMRSISAVSVLLELLRLEAAKSEWSNSYLRRMSLEPF